MRFQELGVIYLFILSKSNGNTVAISEKKDRNVTRIKS